MKINYKTTLTLLEVICKYKLTGGIVPNNIEKFIDDACAQYDIKIQFKGGLYTPSEFVIICSE